MNRATVRALVVALETAAAKPVADATGDLRPVLLARLRRMAGSMGAPWQAYDPAEIVAVCDERIGDHRDSLTDAQQQARQVLAGDYPVTVNSVDSRRRLHDRLLGQALAAECVVDLLCVVRDLAAEDVAAGSSCVSDDVEVGASSLPPLFALLPLAVDVVGRAGLARVDEGEQRCHLTVGGVGEWAMVARGTSFNVVVGAAQDVLWRRSALTRKPHRLKPRGAPREGETPQDGGG